MSLFPKLMLLLCCLVVLSSPGQMAVARQNDEAEQAPAVDESLLTLQKQLKTPRETVNTFLAAMAAKEFDLAGKCLDLSELDAETATAKQDTYVVKLQLAFNRYFGLSELSALSTDAEESEQPYPVSADPELAGIQLVRGEKQLWKFSQSTVKILDSDRFDYLIETKQNEAEAAWSWPLWIQSQFPRSWWGKTFYLKDYEWFCLLALLLGGYLIAWLARYLMDYMTKIWFHLTKTDVDDQPRKLLWTPMLWLLQIWLWYCGMRLIDLPSSVLGVVLPVLKFFTVLAAVWSAFRAINLLQNYLAKKAKLTKSRYDDSLIPFICGTLKLLSIIFGVIIFVDVFEKDWKALLGGFGVVGIAVAIAAKDLLGNIFGSITVLADRPFEIGDWVIIDGKVEGTVENVGIRSSRVRTFHNSEVIVPNSLLTTAIVDNMGRRNYRRFKTHVQIKYNTPTEKIESFCTGIRQLINNNPYAKNDSAHVYLNQLGTSSIDILLYVFFDCGDWAIELRERHCLLMDILKLAEQLGVEFAFPTRTLEIENGANGLDGPNGFNDVQAP